ncbi:MAG: HlyC/CorC family transporter [Candidatus Sumerlaeia bacterium]|nr:HlyC/CorC family transporter [Candidatus Sumerlaeia bacterium]
MTLILVVMGVAACISFLCSMWEASLYAVPNSRVQSMVDQEVRGASTLLALRERIDHPISAILTFNTIANTVGASVMGTLVGKEFGQTSPMIIVFPVVFTFIILVFSEIIPKTLGVIYADRIAPRSAFAISILITVLKPGVIMSEYITTRMRRSTTTGGGESISEADIIAQARMGVEQGALLPEEAQWIQNVLTLNEKTAHDLMTPRTVVYMLSDDLELVDIDPQSEHWSHSRLPVCRGNQPDKVIGIVYRRDVFDMLATNPREEIAGKTISDLMREVEFIPETLRANQVLQRFLQGRQHLFIVTNEHGGLEGVITLEDVIEEILGQEIIDSHDRHADMQEYARSLAQIRIQSMNTGLSNSDDSPPSED